MGSTGVLICLTLCEVKHVRLSPDDLVCLFVYFLLGFRARTDDHFTFELEKGQQRPGMHGNAFS